MAKYVTRNDKYTTAMVTTSKPNGNGGVESVKRELTIADWYKNFEFGGDGYKAFQTSGFLAKNEIVVLITDVQNKKQRRKMTREKWLLYSEPFDGTEKPEDIEDDNAE